MSAWCRIEILLPLRFNDGQPVPESLIAETLSEIRNHFGPVSQETQKIRGVCERRGEPQHDLLTRVFIDVEDTTENHRFFIELKERLKTRFQQRDIWISKHPIDVL